MQRSVVPRTKVAIAVCTYARQEDLERLLVSLQDLQAGPDLCPRVIVIDNDSRKSAETLVQSFQSRLPWPVDYVHEPQAGIPFARNRAIRAAAGDDYLAFVDDDETVDPQWLNALMAVAQKTGAAFVQGPLTMTVEDARDSWWLASGFFKQKSFSDLSPRSESWTNNVLIDLAFVARHNCRFDATLRFDGGSDTLFFQDVVAAGGTGRFAANAMVYEIQKKSRLTWKWATLRQYRYGITRANTVLLRKPRSYAGLYCGIRGTAMVGLGILKLPRGLVLGRAGLADGVALIARGTGVLSGFFGARRREYAR
ncbi:glycosyltransferase family A protein [Leisingera sp. NJS204]|uniref:glycosyltransferase family A protein n=1 Tax=Leisingera sp. NJS204 TaxID=2508307 RepID=UPI0010127199|nr:glycosyltransferase family A protein [Leisingera sp. NJS204]QAX32135.1 glycosyltransferase family 2 protein [Leisingera sp. NJS204]